jgi:hypothetical protein
MDDAHLDRQKDRSCVAKSIGQIARFLANWSTGSLHPSLIINPLLPRYYRSESVIVTTGSSSLYWLTISTAF